MIDRLFADTVLIFHLAFIVFVVLGGLLVLRWHKVAWLHLPAVAWVIFVESTGHRCPLTAIENGLRHAAGDAGYQGSFVDHYLLPIIYPAGLTRDIQMELAIAVLLINLSIYAWLLFGLRRRSDC